MSAGPTSSDAPTGKPYAIMRIMKFKTLGALAAQYEHNMRIIVSENILPDQPAPVELLEGVVGTYSELVTAKFAELGVDPKAQQGKIIAVEAIVTASRVWFDRADASTQQEWVDANIEWAQKKFGKGLVSVKLHLDEETPHLHIVAMPVVAKAKLKRGRPPKDPALMAERKAEAAAAPVAWTLSFHDLMGGHRQNLSREQDFYYGFVKHLGLARGEITHEDGEIALGDGLTMDGAKLSAGVDKGGKDRPRRNLPPKEYRVEIARQHAEAEAALADAIRELDRARALARQSEKARDEAIALRDAALGDRETLKLETAMFASEQALLARDQRQLEHARIEANAAALSAAQAMADAQELGEKTQQERASIDKGLLLIERERAELALITRAADENNGLHLHRTEKSFAMKTGAMTEVEITTYQGNWTKMGVAIARQLAAVLERARHLLLTLTDREGRLKRQEAEIAAKEAAALRAQAEVEASQRANEFANLARIEEIDGRLRDHERREAEVAERERAAKTRHADATRALAEANAQQSKIEAEEQARRAWSEIVDGVTSGKLRAGLRSDGYVKMNKAPLGGRLPAPPHLVQALSQVPPDWAAKIMTKLYEGIRKQLEARDRELAAHELSAALSEKLEKLGKLVPEPERAAIAEVQRKVRRFGDDRGPGM